MRVGNAESFFGGAQYAQRPLVKFDLSSIPSNARISQAWLVMYRRNSSGTLPSPFANVYRVAPRANWSQSGVTWNNRPDWTDPAAQFLNQGANAQYTYYTWDVTEIVINWVTNASTYPNYGLYIKPVQNNTTYYVDFNSKEFGDRSPQLNVSYTIPEQSITIPRITFPTPQPTISIPRITFPTPQPTLSVRIPNLSNLFTTPTPAANGAVWPEIFNLSYFVSGSSATFTWQTSVPTSSQVWYSVDDRYDHYSQFNSSSRTNHTATLTNLNPGTYHYMAVSRDANNRYAYSPRSTFTIAAQGDEPPESDAMADFPTPPPDELFGGFIPDPAGDIDGDGLVNAAPTPAASALPAPTPAVDQNSFFAKIKQTIEDEVAQQLVTARAKAQEKGKTGLFSFNPLLLATGAYGTNKTMGIIFIAASILLVLGALTLLRLSHKTAHHVTKQFTKKD